MVALLRVPLATVASPWCAFLAALMGNGLIPGETNTASPCPLNEMSPQQGGFGHGMGGEAEERTGSWRGDKSLGVIVDLKDWGSLCECMALGFCCLHGNVLAGGQAGVGGTPYKLALGAGKGSYCLASFRIQVESGRKNN